MKNEIKAVVLAAGKGTRMKSETPKVLHKIFNRELLFYVLDNLKSISAQNYVIVGYKADLVENFVKNNFANSKCILQKEQLGTGDALKRAYNYLNGFKGNVLVICGDTPLFEIDSLNNFIKSHEDNNADLSVMSAILENPFGYGRILRNKNGDVQKIIEEKDADQEQKLINEVNAGVYLINWEKIHNAFNALTNNNSQNEYYLTDIILWAIEKKLKVQACPIKNCEEILGINSKKDLALATKIMNKKILEKLMQNGVTITDTESIWISKETQIEADTIIYPNVYISGKNKIGKNCLIGPFSHIRGDVEIGDNVRIGNFVEIKKSVIKSNTNVSHLSYIGDAKLGSGVNIGAGTITANYNPITKEKKETVIKNNANTGSNSVLVAPVVLEENAFVAAGSIVSKNIPENALALTRSPLKIFEHWVK